MSDVHVHVGSDLSHVDPPPRTRLLVTGRLYPATLRRILYGPWRIDFLAESGTRLVAIVSAEASRGSGFGPLAQADRIRSLGNVGVVDQFDASDVTNEVDLILPI